MSNQTGSGASVLADTRAAVVEAVEQAGKGLTLKPRLGFLFLSPRHDLKHALSVARGIAPTVEFIGCHTAGEFTEAGLTRGGMAVMLLASDTIVFDVAWAQHVKAAHEATAKELCARFAETTKEASSQNLGLSTTVLLVDGLAGTGERLVKEVMKGTRMFQQVVGGAAGDDGAFKATGVGARGNAGPDSAAAVHIFDKTQWGVGVDHGL